MRAKVWFLRLAAAAVVLLASVILVPVAALLTIPGTLPGPEDEEVLRLFQ